MIIWINGAFGSGKTQTAYELNKRIENSFVFDPEEVGYYIGSNMPEVSKQSDFQDYPMWRSINASMLDHISSTYDGIVTDNMTIDEVVETIAKDCELEFIEDNRSNFKKRLDRFFVWKKHIRLFG